MPYPYTNCGIYSLGWECDVLESLPSITVLNTAPWLAALLSLLGVAGYLALIFFCISSDFVKLVRENSHTSLLFVGVCCGAVILAGAIGFRGDLAIASDSVEYAVSALNWAQKGIYGFTVDGILHPPRYPFFFSLILIAPWMVIDPSIKIAVLPILLHAILIPIIAAILAQRGRGNNAVVFAPALVLLSPGLLTLSSEVLTQVPVIAVTLMVWLLYLKWQEKSAKHLPTLTGALIFCCALIRPLSILLVIPFVLSAWRGQNRIRMSLPFIMWAIAAISVHLAYSYWVFGQLGRTGYQYWCSIPYDYFNLTFSTRYFEENISFLWNTGIPALFLIFALLCADCCWFLNSNGSSMNDMCIEFRPFLSHSIFFLLTGVVPVGIIHLFYFFPDTGFHVTLFACFAVLAACLLHTILMQGRLFYARWALGMCLLLYVLFCSFDHFRDGLLQPVHRFRTASRMSRYVSAGDVLISGIDPVYVSAFLPTGVKIIPISRNVEFASKLATPRHLATINPPTYDWRDHRNPSLLFLGATEVVHTVALVDSRSHLKLSALPQGRIWLDADFITDRELSAMRDQATLERQGEGNLYRVIQRMGHP